MSALSYLVLATYKTGHVEVLPPLGPVSRKTAQRISSGILEENPEVPEGSKLRSVKIVEIVSEVTPEEVY